MFGSFGRFAASLCRKGAAAIAGAAILIGAAHIATSPAEARNPYPRKSDSAPHDGVAAARMHAVQGIDVSKYQLEIDWREVKRAGTRFAFIKATEGGDHLDVSFRDNWEGAKEAGVPRGAYHFVFWCRPAKDQIRWFIRNVPKEADALPPVLDVEWNHLSRCPRTTPEKARAKMREMLRAFEAHYGKKPIIYTDITFHEDVLEGTREFDDYPFWIRSVAAKPHVRYENRPWEFWQFTATGRVPGIRGDVDRNAFYGTEKQFSDWMAGRYDIGSRRPLKGEPLAAPAIADGKPVAKPVEPPKSIVARREPLPPTLDLKPANGPILPGRVEPRRPALARTATSEPLMLLPPGRVPDVTNSIVRRK
jgi:lysozyme